VWNFVSELCAFFAEKVGRGEWRSFWRFAGVFEGCFGKEVGLWWFFAGEFVVDCVVKMEF
jgi:hypothetical protein